MATMAGQPGSAEMSIGSVLSRAFGAVGAAPVSFFGTSLVLAAIPYAGLMAVIRSPFYRPAVPGISPFAIDWPVLLVVGIGWWLLYLVAKAVLVGMTVAELDREPATIRDHLAAAGRVLLPLVGLGIVTSIALAIGFMVLIVPGIVLYLIWAVTTPALVAEREGVFAAFDRSGRLTKGARWRIFGLSLVVWVIYIIAAAAFGIVALLARSISPDAIMITRTATSVILQTGFVAIWTAIQATLYVELRDERDGPAGRRLADIFA